MTRHLKYLVLSLGLFLRTNAQTSPSKIDLGKGISITAKISVFEPSKHKYDSCDSGLGWKSICLIDNKIWFGSDAGLELPKYQLDSLSISIDGRTLGLDVSGLYNPTFSQTINKDAFELVKAENGYSLTGFFSDGAGAYLARWQIVKNVSARTIVSRDIDLLYPRADK